MSGFDRGAYKLTTQAHWQSAAEAWQRWAPILEHWLNSATARMLDQARIGAGDQVLDLAAGTGGQTVAAAERVGSTGMVLATDIASNFLAFVEKNAQQAQISNITTRMMDAEQLDLSNEQFDAVISRLGLMFFPDRHKALTEIYRVLKPGGRLATMVFASAQENLFLSIPIEIIRRHAQLPPAESGQPGPFSCGVVGMLEEEYQLAGFHETQTYTVSAPLQLASAATCLSFEQEAFGALHQMLAEVGTIEREMIWEEIGQELRRFEGPGGFEAACTLLLVIGTR